MSDDYVTRNEFNLLNSKVDQIYTRVEGIDQSGTRGVLALQQQIVDAVKDITDIRLDLNSFKKDTAANFDSIQKDAALRYEQDRRDRMNSRRWTIATWVAVMGSLGGLYAFLIDVLQHIHLERVR